MVAKRIVEPLCEADEQRSTKSLEDRRKMAYHAALEFLQKQCLGHLGDDGKRKGMSEELAAMLNELFGENLREDKKRLWSHLGQAKRKYICPPKKVASRTDNSDEEEEDGDGTDAEFKKLMAFRAVIKGVNRTIKNGCTTETLLRLMDTVGACAAEYPRLAEEAATIAIRTMKGRPQEYEVQRACANVLAEVMDYNFLKLHTQFEAQDAIRLALNNCPEDVQEPLLAVQAKLGLGEPTSWEVHYDNLHDPTSPCFLEIRRNVS